MLFGLELEYFIIDENQFPFLCSAERIIQDCHKEKLDINVTQELSSFQIELNPGPWELSSDGIKKGIEETKKQEELLLSVASEANYFLDYGAMPPRLNEEIINSSLFFSNDIRFRSSADYFKDRLCLLYFEDNTSFLFPGETAVGCLNEIHFNIQLSSDKKTLLLFNYLNKIGNDLIAELNDPVFINGKKVKDGYSPFSLFIKSNGGFNRTGDINRVCFLENEILSYSEYMKIVNSFEKIPILNSSKKYLDLESTVYFWIRLRKNNYGLRLEFRPIDMNLNWEKKVEEFFFYISPYIYSIEKNIT